MLRVSEKLADLIHTSPGSIERSVPGVPLREIEALRQLDMVVGPEHFDERSVDRFQLRNEDDLQRLGPLEHEVRSAEVIDSTLARVAVQQRSARDRPAAAAPDAIVREARMIAVLEHIHHIRTAVRGQGRRVE